MATRIDQLARPKPNLLKFPDRRSVYWLDELPPSSNSSSTAFDLTPRWSKLAESKKLIPHFEDNRQSPGWKPDRPLLPTVSVAVRTAKANAWICQLARPRKMRAAMTQLCSSEISPSVPSLAKPSPRTHLLATPKQDHPQYCPDRPVSWPVAKPALEAVASERLQVLATPRLRKPLFEGFDPYRVSSAARAATASPRLQELALPPARRCRRR
ncbi:hypothetical protein SRHO_G00240350 [Serrasalmus rhombeus]